MSRPIIDAASSTIRCIDYLINFNTSSVTSHFLSVGTWRLFVLLLSFTERFFCFVFGSSLQLFLACDPFSSRQFMTRDAMINQVVVLNLCDV